MPLKRKHADRADWRRVTRRGYAQLTLQTDSYAGHVSIVRIDDLREPLYSRTSPNPLVLADCGYQWMLQIPDGSHHAVTTIFDAGGRIIQWYIDMFLRTGQDGNGVPWFDDLFLDLVVLPDGPIFVKDAEELDEALCAQQITSEEFNLAWNELLHVKDEVEQGRFAPILLAQAHRELVLAELEA